MVEYLERHINLFYELLGHNNLGFTEIRIIDVNGKKVIKSEFVNTKYQFLKVCKEWSGKYNVYAGRLPRKTQEFGTIKNIEWITVITLDIDAKHEPGIPATTKQIEPVTEAVIEVLKQYPSGIPYFTGNGFCIWFKFIPFKIADNPGFIEKSKEWSRNIKQKVEEKFDVVLDQMGDVARIQKVSGTKSVKGAHAEDTPHRLSQFSESVLNRYENDIFPYSMDVLLESKEIVIEKVEFVAAKEFSEYFNFLLRTNNYFRRVWYGEKEFKSASENDLAVANFLVQNSVPDADILFCLEHSPYRKNDNGRKDKFELIVDKAKECKTDVEKRSVRDWVKDYYLLLAGKKKQKSPEIYIGFDFIDDFLWLQRKELMVFGGLPSSGKTALLLQSTFYNVTKGKKVLYVSTEMGWEEVINRTCAQQLKIEYTKFRRGTFTTDERKKIYHFLECDVLKNFFIFDKGNPTITEVEKMVYMFKPDLIIYDHIQQGRGVKEDNQAKEIMNIMQELKNVARSQNICVFVASQLSRTSEGVRPTRYHLYGSAGIEQGADFILLLHPLKDMVEETEWDVDLILDKGRNTGTRDFKLHFVGKNISFIG